MTSGSTTGAAGTPLNAPADTTGTAAGQWVSGCAAGYWAARPGTATPAAAVATPTVTQAVTPTPTPTVTKTVVAPPAPVAPAPQLLNAQAVVTQYYADINDGDFADAWNVSIQGSRVGRVTLSSPGHGAPVLRSAGFLDSRTLIDGNRTAASLVGLTVARIPAAP